MFTSIGEENNGDEYETSNRHNSKDKDVLEIWPRNFASEVNQECIGLKQSKCT